MREPAVIAGVLTALLAMPAAAQHERYGPINCIYDSLSPAQRGQFDLEALDSDKNYRIVERPMQACADKWRWPAELFLVVIEHMNARIGYERAETLMVRAGATAGDIEKAWRAIDKADRRKLRDSDYEAGAALRKVAPNLVRFGAPAVTALRDYAEMKHMEEAWSRIDPHG